MQRSRKLIFMDTCVLNEVVKNPRLFKLVVSYLLATDGTLALSTYSICELSDAHGNLQALATRLWMLPFFLVLNSDDIKMAELDQYPGPTVDIRVHSPNLEILTSSDPASTTLRMLQGYGVPEARRHMRDQADIFGPTMTGLKKNIPPVLDGKYHPDFGVEFSNLVTFQFIAQRNYDLARRLLATGNPPDLSFFRATRLTAAIVYFRYYVGESAYTPSDYGDLQLASVIPYCDHSFAENTLTSEINRIAKIQPGLVPGKVANLAGLRRLVGY